MKLKKLSLPTVVREVKTTVFLAYFFKQQDIRLNSLNSLNSFNFLTTAYVILFLIQLVKAFSFFLMVHKGVCYWHSLHTGRVGAKVFYKTGIEGQDCIGTSLHLLKFFINSLLNRLKAEFNDVSCDL